MLLKAEYQFIFVAKKNVKWELLNCIGTEWLTGPIILKPLVVPSFPTGTRGQVRKRD